MGVTLNSSKWFRTTGLDAAHARVKKNVGKKIKELQGKGGIMLASDGWSKKAAEKGEPLANMCVLKPDGGYIYES
eukprot:350286-Chlamydomonas_euryale.AAC.2